MKAIIVHSDKELTLEDVPTPTLSDGEVLVEVKAAGVNRADLLH